jgi:uncharacterized integral membrane protein
MRKFFAWIALAPIAVIAILFAVANRGRVTVSLDPFSVESPAYAIDLPMFLVIFAALIIGVVIGGISVWFGRLRWQMAAHRAEKELARVRAENAEAAERRQQEFGGGRPLLPPH